MRPLDPDLNAEEILDEQQRHEAQEELQDDDREAMREERQRGETGPTFGQWLRQKLHWRVSKQ